MIAGSLIAYWRAIYSFPPLEARKREKESSLVLHFFQSVFLFLADRFKQAFVQKKDDDLTREV